MEINPFLFKLSHILPTGWSEFFFIQTTGLQQISMETIFFVEIYVLFQVDTGVFHVSWALAILVFIFNKYKVLSRLLRPIALASLSQESISGEARGKPWRVHCSSFSSHYICAPPLLFFTSPHS